MSPYLDIFKELNFDQLKYRRRGYNLGNISPL